MLTCYKLYMIIKSTLLNNPPHSTTFQYLTPSIPYIGGNQLMPESHRHIYLLLHRVILFKKRTKNISPAGLLLIDNLLSLTDEADPH
jgi:hypothetical protein